MKITELSIGDWVEIDGEPAKALCLRIAGGHIFKGISGQMYRCCGGMDFHPIPLTPEILEKNGFFHNGDKWYTPELFTLERWSKGWSIVIACTCGDYVCEVCTIKYVHQLQHALRLAGVEKEITI